jgi:hypothetical protein
MKRKGAGKSLTIYLAMGFLTFSPNEGKDNSSLSLSLF